jgi:hypothetical protein
LILVGEVRGGSGEVMDAAFQVSAEQVAEGVAWMRCPECLGDPRGYRLPDDTFVRCNFCKGRRAVPIAV